MERCGAPISTLGPGLYGSKVPRSRFARWLDDQCSAFYVMTVWAKPWKLLHQSLSARFCAKLAFSFVFSFSPQIVQRAGVVSSWMRLGGAIVRAATLASWGSCLERLWTSPTPLAQQIACRGRAKRFTTNPNPSVVRHALRVDHAAF